MIRNSVVFLSTILLATILFSGCSVNPETTGPQDREIILATTTSTYDSGLLDELVPVFEADLGYRVKIVSVGTGQALTMGREGNADILLVHAPASEKEFMDQGYGIERQLVMHNDFVIVGSPSDPAGIRGLQSPMDVFAKIAGTQAPFISRGDDSGTHKKEMDYWAQIGITPNDPWYLETGQGMGATLQVAAEKEAYTLTDRATYISLRDTFNLEILVEGDSSLLNIYHVIVVNPELWPVINLTGARALAEFLVSSTGQAIIAEFGIEKYGQPLFFPDAGKLEMDS